MEKEQICKEIFGYKKEKFVIFAENGNGFLAKIDVAPFVGAWIEIYECSHYDYTHFVAPFVGAWIEILLITAIGDTVLVAPFVGAWIEIDSGSALSTDNAVAPFVGAWIEITKHPVLHLSQRSLPSWERGLKYGRTDFSGCLGSCSLCGCRNCAWMMSR